MRLILTAVGRLKAGPERELSGRYLERAQAICRSVGLNAVEVRELDESRSRRPDDRKSDEAEAIMSGISAGARIILLDERGKSLSSEAFAQDVATARDDGISHYNLVIGGPDGLSPALREASAMTVCFGAMTWPHQLVRVMALEQIYRALTILSGHPYHRA